MFKRDAYREVLCVLKTKRDVCARLCVLCVVHARKINVTCLVKVFYPKMAREGKNTRAARRRLFAGLSSGCALSITSLLFLSLSLSLVVVSTTY